MSPVTAGPDRPEDRPRDGSPSPRVQLHEPFAAARARRVALTLAVAQFAVLTLVAFTLPGEGAGASKWYDRLGMLAVSGFVAWMLWRLARVRAVPSETGLTVRNLMTTRTLDWAQIVAVRFGGGGPWVTLDLAEGDTLAVMAVQRADGPRAQLEARRLATLVALHSRTGRDD